jgi:3-dehydrotetronate 4-kinase
MGEACAGMALITGGSGAAIGLPENFQQSGLLMKREGVAALESVGGSGVVLSGSCSAATLAQVESMKSKFPARAIDPAALIANFEETVANLVSWARDRFKDSPVLIYASEPPEKVEEIQARFGREQAGLVVEKAIAAVALKLVELGVRRFVVAGGETSGAVVSALGIEALEIGPQIAPGVPATLSTSEPRIALALKSGNFGGPEFFMEALASLK